MTVPIFYQWAAICFVFVIASLWGEENTRFGYVILPIFMGLFWWMGWIQFAYLAAVIPILIFMGVFAYMREQAKVKWGIFGSGSGILPKIIAFVVFLQFAIILVNGMVIFQDQQMSNPSNEFTSYSVEKAEAVYGDTTVSLGIVDSALMGLTLIWTQFQLFFTIVFSFFGIYKTLVSTFHVPMALATVISGGIYLLTAIEVFVLIFKPYRAPEI